MIQERPLCYENTGNDDSLCGRENLTSSVNILSHTASSRDPPAHEDGRALALIKYLIWICFVSLIVLALWIVFYWKQSPNVLDDSTNKGIISATPICDLSNDVIYHWNLSISLL